MASPEPYILGVDPVELERLRFQHFVWAGQMHAVLRDAGVREGDTALDLGCGPGATTLELASWVGPGGRVIACDESEACVDHVRHACAARGIEHVEAVCSPVETLELPEASVDVVYARWLFCWLEEPEAAFRRAASFLKPGGAMAVQEYINWGAASVFPGSEVVEDALAACRRSWEVGGATMDIGRRMPEFAERAGLVVERFAPEPRLGRAGSLEWRWMGTFLAGYLLKLIDRGLYTRERYDAFTREWARLAGEPSTYAYPPVVGSVVMRRP